MLIVVKKIICEGMRGKRSTEHIPTILGNWLTTCHTLAGQAGRQAGFLLSYFRYGLRIALHMASMAGMNWPTVQVTFNTTSLTIAMFVKDLQFNCLPSIIIIIFGHIALSPCLHLVIKDQANLQIYFTCL